MAGKVAVDSALEARFRAGYCRGWVGAVDALSQLCEARGLAPAEAAEMLKAHHADALARWLDGPLQHSLYPPRVPRRAAL